MKFKTVRTCGKSWALRELKKHLPKMVELKADFSKRDDFCLPDNKPFYYSEFATKKESGKRRVDCF